MVNSGAVPYGWTVADYLVFQKVRSALGFDRCNYFLTSAAPIRRETLDFFMSLNIPLMEVYGMSECSGRLTIFHLELNIVDSETWMGLPET